MGRHNKSLVCTWNYVLDPVDGHQTSAVNGVGLGIVVSGSGTRVEDCYLDTVPLVINMTGSASLITGNLFLKNASVVLSAPKWQLPSVKTGVRDLIITNNMFNCFDNAQVGACEKGAVILDETGSQFGGVFGTRVESNLVASAAGYKSTKARKRAQVQAAKSVLLDFSAELLFPRAPLANGTASCTLWDGAPVPHSLSANVTGAPLSLEVYFAEAWSGTVECSVDQSPARAAL